MARKSRRSKSKQVDNETVFIGNLEDGSNVTDVDDNDSIATHDTSGGVLQGSTNDNGSTLQMTRAANLRQLSLERPVLEKRRNSSATIMDQIKQQQQLLTSIQENNKSDKNNNSTDDSDDEDEASMDRARIFDFRRISILCIAVVITISVVVGTRIGFDKPPDSFNTAIATPAHPTEDGLPHLHKYAYVFVAYDKSGYTVAQQYSQQLQKLMEERDAQKENSDRLKHPSGGHLKEQFIDTHSAFNLGTGCTEFNLESNTVTILESPEFHCSMSKLRSLFMDHKDTTQEKWGVKLVHLVRDPFTMAAADYRDHKFNQMPGEIRFKNPCNSLTESYLNTTVADLNAPMLEQNGIMTSEDFGNIWKQCNDIFQTQPGLETATYQQHLERLTPADGLKLTVADGLKNIVSMASDIISFKNVYALVDREASNPRRKKIRHLDEMMVPLDTVLNYPGSSMIEFLNFIFGESMSASDKRRAASEYEQNQIVDDSTDVVERRALIGILKNTPVVGGAFERIQHLIGADDSDNAQ